MACLSGVLASHSLLPLGLGGFSVYCPRLPSLFFPFGFAASCWYDLLFVSSAGLFFWFFYTSISGYVADVRGTSYIVIAWGLSWAHGWQHLDVVGPVAYWRCLYGLPGKPYWCFFVLLHGAHVFTFLLSSWAFCGAVVLFLLGTILGACLGGLQEFWAS